MLRILWIGAKVAGAYVASQKLGEWAIQKIPHANDDPPPAWRIPVTVGTKVSIGIATYVLESMVIG